MPDRDRSETLIGLGRCGHTVTFGRVKVEVGAIATAWQPRHGQDELRLAQRYLPAISNSTGSQELIGQGYIHNTTVSVFIADLPTPARVAPTGISVPTATAFRIAWPTGGGTTSDSSTVTFASASMTKAQVNLGLASANGTAAVPATFNSLSGGVILFTGCEL